MENVSYIYDHSIGRSVLGFCIVSLGLFTGQRVLPLDFHIGSVTDAIKKVPSLTMAILEASAGR